MKKDKTTKLPIKTLKQLREETNLNRTEVAEQCYIHPMTLYNYEQFRSEPTVTIAIQLAQFYKRKIEEIKWVK